MRWRGDDCVSGGRAGVARGRADRYAALFGVSDYAELGPGMQHRSDAWGRSLCITTMLLDANRIEEHIHAEFDQSPRPTGLAP
jgi:hypothetical protein